MRLLLYSIYVESLSSFFSTRTYYMRIQKLAWITSSYVRSPMYNGFEYHPYILLYFLFRYCCIEFQVRGFSVYSKLLAFIEFHGFVFKIKWYCIEC